MQQVARKRQRWISALVQPGTTSAPPLLGAVGDVREQRGQLLVNVQVVARAMLGADGGGASCDNLGLGRRGVRSGHGGGEGAAQVEAVASMTPPVGGRRCRGIRRRRRRRHPRLGRLGLVGLAGLDLIEELGEFLILHRRSLQPVVGNLRSSAVLLPGANWRPGQEDTAELLEGDLPVAVQVHGGDDLLDGGRRLGAWEPVRDQL
mmetsp:Transcript_12694/g.34793  ORF Transcript_12694/g.34793 Transcript_12694/m.34793 type:complete len:205 (-) Transcript_12694:461-1075(-)